MKRRVRVRPYDKPTAGRTLSDASPGGARHAIPRPSSARRTVRSSVDRPCPAVINETAYSAAVRCGGGMRGYAEMRIAGPSRYGETPVLTLQGAWQTQAAAGAEGRSPLLRTLADRRLRAVVPSPQQVVQQVEQLRQRTHRVDQAGDGAEQVAQQVARPRLAGDVEDDLVELDPQAEQIEVERAEHQV